MKNFSGSKMLNWSAAIQHCENIGSGYVIATIINTQGSTPRNSGSKMVIDVERIYDTIGGGQLEYLIIQQAREMLAKNQNCQILKPFPLAAEAAQCCGGNVTVMLECFAARDWQIVLFGAGHVCQALIKILSGLPCQVRIIDNRPQLLQQLLPDNCRYEFYEQPANAVITLPTNSWIVIFTHDHALDFQLCSACLTEDRWHYLGLIGSQTKALRFRKRLSLAGFDEKTIEKIHSPVGLPEVKGKFPMEVAVSIAAQLQSLFYAEKKPKAQSTSWRNIKTILQQANNSTEHPTTLTQTTEQKV